MSNELEKLNALSDELEQFDEVDSAIIEQKGSNFVATIIHDNTYEGWHVDMTLTFASDNFERVETALKEMRDEIKESQI